MDKRTPTVPGTSGHLVPLPGQRRRVSEPPAASSRRRWPQPSPAPRRTRSPPPPTRAMDTQGDEEYEGASIGSSIFYKSEKAALVSTGNPMRVSPPRESRLQQKPLGTQPRPKTTPTAAKALMKRSFQQPTGWLRREMGDAPYVAAPVQESPEGDMSTAALLTRDVRRDDPGFSGAIDAQLAREGQDALNPPSMLATAKQGRPELAKRGGKPATHKHQTNVYVELREPDKVTHGDITDLVASELMTRTGNLPSKTGHSETPKYDSTVGSEVSLTIDTTIQHRKASLLETISTSISAALGKFIRKGREQPVPAPRSGGEMKKQDPDHEMNLLPAGISEKVEIKVKDVLDTDHSHRGQHSGGMSNSCISIDQWVTMEGPNAAIMPQARPSLKHKQEYKQRRHSELSKPPTPKDDTSGGTIDEPTPHSKGVKGRNKKKVGKKVDSQERDLGVERKPSVAAESKARMTKTAAESRSGDDPAKTEDKEDANEGMEERQQEGVQPASTYEPQGQRRGSAGDRKKGARRNSGLKDAGQEEKHEEAVKSPDEASKSILRTDAKSKSHVIPFQRRLSNKTTSERFVELHQGDKLVTPKAPKHEGTDGHPDIGHNAEKNTEPPTRSRKSKRQSRDEGRRPSKSEGRDQRKKKTMRTSHTVSESSRKGSTVSKDERNQKDHHDASRVKKEGEPTNMTPDREHAKDDETIAKTAARVEEAETVASEAGQDKRGSFDAKDTPKKKGRRKSRTREGSVKGDQELKPKRVHDRKAHEGDVEDATEKKRTTGQESKRPPTGGETDAHTSDTKGGGPKPMKVAEEFGPMHAYSKSKRQEQDDVERDRGSRRNKVNETGRSRIVYGHRRDKSKKSKVQEVESVEVSTKCVQTQTCLVAPVVDAGGTSCRDFNFGMTLSPFTTGTIARKELKTAGVPLLYPSQSAVISRDQTTMKTSEDHHQEVTPPPAPQESAIPPETNGAGPRSKDGKRKKRSKRRSTEPTDKTAERSKANSKSGRRSKSKRGKKRKKPSKKENDGFNAANLENEKGEKLPKESGGGEDEKNVHEKKEPRKKKRKELKNDGFKAANLENEKDEKLPKESGGGEDEKSIHEKKEPRKKKKTESIPRDAEPELGPQKEKPKNKKSAKKKKAKRSLQKPKTRKTTGDESSKGEIPFLFRWGPATIPIFTGGIHSPLSWSTMQTRLDEGEQLVPRESAWSTIATVSTKNGTHGLPLSSSEFPAPEGSPPLSAANSANVADNGPVAAVTEEPPKKRTRKKKRSRSTKSKKKRSQSKDSKEKRSRSKTAAELPDGEGSSNKGGRGLRLKSSLKRSKRTSKTEEEMPFTFQWSPTEGTQHPLSWSTMPNRSGGGERQSQGEDVWSTKVKTRASIIKSLELPSPDDEDRIPAPPVDVVEGSAIEPPANDIDIGPKEGLTEEPPKKRMRKKKRSRSKKSKKKRSGSKVWKEERSRSKGFSERPEADHGSKKAGRGHRLKSSLKRPKRTSKTNGERPFSFQWGTSPPIDSGVCSPLSWSTIQIGPNSGQQYYPGENVRIGSADMSTPNMPDITKSPEEELDKSIIHDSADGATKESMEAKQKEALHESEIHSEDLPRPSKKKRSRSKGSKKMRARLKGSKGKRGRSRHSKKKRRRLKGSKGKRSRSKDSKEKSSHSTSSSRRHKVSRGSKESEHKSSKHKRRVDDMTPSPDRKGPDPKSSLKHRGRKKRKAKKHKSELKRQSDVDSPKGAPSIGAPSSTEERITRETKAEDKASTGDLSGEQHRDFNFNVSRRPVITGLYAWQAHNEAHESQASAKGAMSSPNGKSEHRKRHKRRKKAAKRKLDRKRPPETASPASPASPRAAPRKPIDKEIRVSRHERAPPRKKAKGELPSESGVPKRREFAFVIRPRPVTRGTLARPELTEAIEPEIAAAFERVQDAFVFSQITQAVEATARYTPESSSRDRGKKRPSRKHRDRKARRGHSRSTRSKSRRSKSRSESRRPKSRRSRRSGKSTRSSRRPTTKKGRQSKSKKRGRKSDSRSKRSGSRESSRSKRRKRRRRHRRESRRHRKHGKRGGRRSKSPRKRSHSSKRGHRRKEKSKENVTEDYIIARKERGFWYLCITCLAFALIFVLCALLLYYTLYLKPATPGTAPPPPSTAASTIETEYESSSESPPPTHWTGTIGPETMATAPATVSTSPPDTHVYYCSSDYCQNEGRYISALLRRETDPCDNFYQHVCAHWVNNHVPDAPLHTSLVSESTLVRDALLNKLVDIVLRAKQGDIQVAAKLYSACHDSSQSNDLDNTHLRYLFSQWAISNWPRTARIPNGVIAVWSFAAELIRDIGLTTIVAANVGVNPDKLDATLIKLDQPQPLLRDAGSGNQDIRELFAGAVQEATDFLSGAPMPRLADSLFEARAALAALSPPSYSYSDDEHANFVVRQFGQLGEGLRQFLRVLLVNVSSSVDPSKKVLLRSPPYLLEELDGKLNQMPALDVLNYMGFLVFVHISPFLPTNKAAKARLLFAETTMGYTAGVSERYPMCSQLAEWALPECFVKASQMKRQSENQDVAAREWLYQLESVFLRNVADFIWMTDLSSLIVRYRIKRRATTLFGQLAGEQRQCAPARLTTHDPVLFYFNVLKHQRQLMLEGLLANSSILQKRVAVSDLSAVATFRPELHTIHVPAALFNASVPINSSVFAFHLARVAVRFYRALVQLLYENPYEREAPLSYSKESQWIQAGLVACFGRDAQRTVPTLQSSYEAHLGRAFLDRTLALQLSLRAFDELFNVRRIWKLDLRLQDLPDTSAEQLFFIYFALDNCEYAHPDIHRDLLPAEQRVNLPLRHMRRFAKAFHCRGRRQMVAPDGDFCQVLRSDQRARRA